MPFLAHEHGPAAKAVARFASAAGRWTPNRSVGPPSRRILEQL